MEEPASLKEKEKERIFSEIISGLLIITTILKVKSIAFQVFFEFFFFFGAIGSFKNFKTFNVKAFLFLFFFLRKSINFGSQGCTGLGRSAVVYILLYGFIYFFTVQISWKIFSKCHFGFINPFFSFPQRYLLLSY